MKNINSIYKDDVFTKTNKTFAIANELIPHLMGGLSCLELKLILREIATINKTTSEILPHKCSVASISDELRLNNSSKNIYKHISDSIERLCQKGVRIINQNDEEELVSWLTMGEHDEKDSNIFRLSLNSSLKNLFINLEENFTVFDTEIIKKFSNARALGMYMYLYSLFKRDNNEVNDDSSSVSVYFMMDELQEMLVISPKHGIKYVEKKILVRIKKQIEENTDFVFDFERYGIGNKCFGFKLFFSFSKNVREYLKDIIISPIPYKKLSGYDKLYLSMYAKHFNVSTEEFCRVRNMLLDFEIYGAENLMTSVKQTLMNIEANIVYCITRYKDKLDKIKLATFICNAILQNYVGNDVEKQKQVIQTARFLCPNRPL